MEEKLIEKLSSATSAADIKTMADEHGIEITDEQAEALFANLQAVIAKEGEISDEALMGVAGGTFSVLSSSTDPFYGKKVC